MNLSSSVLFEMFAGGMSAQAFARMNPKQAASFQKFLQSVGDKTYRAVPLEQWKFFNDSAGITARSSSGLWAEYYSQFDKWFVHRDRD